MAPTAQENMLALMSSLPMLEEGDLPDDLENANETGIIVSRLEIESHVLARQSQHAPLSASA